VICNCFISGEICRLQIHEVLKCKSITIDLNTSDHQFGLNNLLAAGIFSIASVILLKVLLIMVLMLMCALDLSKAFDRMNHYVLLSKLIDRKLPNEVLSVLESWFSLSVTCVKWVSHVSPFSILAEVRQGVPSPVLFSIFIDDLILKVNKTDVGCYLSTSCVSIFLFAEDILLLSPTLTGLQTLFNTCERELEVL